jgi:sugar phosphate isomerase/epimerase
MKIEQVAAQLYTLRDHLKTPSQVSASLKKVRKIGYQAVQVSGLGPIDPAELRKILDGEGLVCCSTHENSATILDNPETVVATLNILGCTYTAYPYPSNADLTSVKGVKDFVRRLNNAGRVLKENGKVLTYHNHDIEFTRLKGRTVLEIIYDETDPELLKGELDTHWVQTGGGSTVAWCRRLAGRLPLLHLKDFALTSDRKRVFAEIGSGNMNWEDIIPAAEEAGCRWFIVEQDGDWVDNDPFKSLKASFRYIEDELTE